MINSTHSTIPILFIIALASLHSMGWSQELPFQERILPALLNKTVQAQLELTDEQKTKLKGLLQSIQSKQREYGAELKTLKESGAAKGKLEEKREERIAQLAELKKEIQQDALDTLLPHQLRRLRQVTVQVMMRESAKSNRTQSGLLTKEMIEFLEIDSDQQQKIRQKSLELQKKLLEEMKQLQKKYTKELLKELSAKQRKKYEDAIGEPIDR